MPRTRLLRVGRGWWGRDRITDHAMLLITESQVEQAAATPPEFFPGLAACGLLDGLDGGRRTADGERVRVGRGWWGRVWL